MAGFKTIDFVVTVPIICGLAYMLLHDDLSRTAVILITCLIFTTAMMFIVYKVQEGRLKEEIIRNDDGIDRSMFKACKAATIPAVFKMLQECTAFPTSTNGTVSILHFLRESVRSDVLVAVELTNLDAVQHILKALGSKKLDPKSAIASLELINEVLSAKQAKLKLTTNIAALHAATDAAYLWLLVVLYSLVSELQLPPGTVQLSNSAITAISGMGVNLLELTADPAAAFPAGTTSVMKVEQLISICSKTLVSVGLLCSDECPDAQTRFADRGGVQLLLSALNTALLMCSTTSTSQGIGAKSSAGAGDKAGSVRREGDKTLRLKQSSLICKWASWCMFNLTLEHPPSKAELFHSSGIRVFIDVLKLHRDSAHVHRQSLALLLSLIAPSPQYVQCAYSQAQARQMMMANSIVEVLEADKVTFKKEKDVLVTSRAIANLIMVDYS